MIIDDHSFSLGVFSSLISFSILLKLFQDAIDFYQIFTLPQNLCHFHHFFEIILFLLLRNLQINKTFVLLTFILKQFLQSLSVKEACLVHDSNSYALPCCEQILFKFELLNILVIVLALL